ncbi:MAG TPA: pyridoxamine 5'-phosphate oxidase family protein, partial [Gaiellaceae bacterium]|nr:pyridoxamine 5'-phosphate oxidase family protein [Gaiellaceae bacterium]
WVDVAGGKVGFNTAVGRAKERYLRNDPRIALIVVDPGNSYKWVSISGRVEFTEDGSDAQIDKLAKKYLNADTYPFRNDTEVRVSVWIDADKVDSSGFE